LIEVGYVFIGDSYFACLLAGLRKNYSTDFHEIRWTRYNDYVMRLGLTVWVCAIRRFMLMLM